VISSCFVCWLLFVVVLVCVCFVVEEGEGEGGTGLCSVCLLFGLLLVIGCWLLVVGCWLLVVVGWFGVVCCFVRENLTL